MKKKKKKQQINIHLKVLHLEQSNANFLKKVFNLRIFIIE